MTIKAIFQGRLQFGNAKKFNRALEMYIQRSTNFYRSDVFVKENDFDEESFSLVLPKKISEGSKKSWVNTIKMLNFIADYALAGSIQAYITKSGKAEAYELIQANKDRGCVQSYLKGCSISNEQGKAENAIKAFGQAIEKFDQYAQAYEKRGQLFFVLGKYEKAIQDFDAGISADPFLAEAYLGRGLVNLTQKNYKAAAEDLEKAVKNSIPLRSLYWVSRRLKGDCHMALNQQESAIKEYKIFCSKQFEADDPNFNWKRYGYMRYSEALLESDKPEEALKVLDNALQLDSEDDKVNLADILLLRGMAMKQAGRPGFVGALKEAAKAGSEKAANLLVEVAA